MSPILASAIALLICVAFMLPTIWMGLGGAGARILAPLSMALVVGIALVESGTFDRAPLKSVGLAMATETQGSRCRRIMNLLIQHSVLVQQPGPEGLIVRGQLWDQFPEPVRQAVLMCAQRPTGASAAGEVKVIRR
jgi:hypothetical protein